MNKNRTFVLFLFLFLYTFKLVFDIMCGKGRAGRLKNYLLCLHEQTIFQAFGERSDLGKL